MAKRPKTQNLKPPGKCVFCEGGAVPDNPMTREHLWSDWMAPLLPKGEEYHEFRATFSNDGLRILQEAARNRPGAAHTKKIKMVCRSCNNGWMSNIEDEVKPFLTPLITDTPYLLAAEHQNTIARWIALKLLVAEHDTFGNHPADPIFSQETRNSFMLDRKIPFGFRIWIARQKGEDWKTGFFIHTSTLTFSRTLPPKSPPKGAPRNVQAFCWGIGSLFIYALATTNPDLYYGMEEFGINHFIRIWPPSRSVIWWPPNEWFDDEALNKMPRLLQTMVINAGDVIDSD